MDVNDHLQEEKNMRPLWTHASVWTHRLVNYTFPTEFVPLSEEDRKILIARDTESNAAEQIIKRIDKARQKVDNKWNVFAYADSVAPTDTPRFELRRGAISSAKSIWITLCESEKVHQAAINGDVEFVTLRPFRFMTYPREFRLFIHKGKLRAMSQKCLKRHYKRFAAKSIQETLYSRAEQMIQEVSSKIPTDTYVMDIYFTQALMPMIIDLNEFGEPTDPLLMRKWDIDWEVDYGLRLIPPTTKVAGDINVAF